MTTDAWLHLLWVVVAGAAWLAVYRLPFAKPRTRKRIKLAVSTNTGLDPRYVFPILGTLIYLVMGFIAIAVVIVGSGPSLATMFSWDVSLRDLSLTGFAMVGAACVTAFAMSMVYAVARRVDIPTAVNNVVWIREVMALPVQWRWTIPMSSAAVEETFFRGVLLVGLLAADTPVWLAIAIASIVFTTGQVILTENRLQALVLAISSVVISVVGGLLVVITGSIVPAIVVHAAFAGFYTNNNPQAAQSSAQYRAPQSAKQ